MSDHMAAMADSQIEGAQSENEALRCEVDELKEAYALLFKANALLRQGVAEFRRECGDTDSILCVLGLDPVNCRTDGGSLKLTMIQGAIEHRDAMTKRAARLDERERCAAICDGIARQYKNDSHGHAAERAANAIRLDQP